MILPGSTILLWTIVQCYSPWMIGLQTWRFPVPIAYAEADHAWSIFDIEVSPNHMLYLHPSHNSGTSPISTKPTGPKNYSMWSRSMIVSLRGKNKIDFIDLSFDKDLFKPALHDLWERCNTAVFRWIFELSFCESFQ